MLRRFACLALTFAMLGCAGSQTKKISAEERAALYVDAANSAMMDSDSVSAFEYLKKAEEIAPNMPEIYHTRGLVLASQKEYSQAIESVRKAVSLRATYSAANNTLGKLLMDNGKPDEAVKYLIAAAKDPLNREAFKPYTNLGILYYRKMDYAEAGKYLDHAVIAEPNGACIAYYYRGHVDLQKGRVSQAIHDYDQATRRFCAGFAEAHLALGIAYERSGQYDAARKKYLEIRNHFSTSVVAEQATHHLKHLP